MMRSQWMRRGVLGAYVLVAAFLLAHSVNAFVERSLIVDSGEPLTASPPPRIEPPPLNPKALMQSILTGRLFPLPADTDPESGLRRAAPPAPPLDVAKKFRLLGTAVNPLSDGFAVLEDLSSQKQTLYRLNDTVQPVGILATIEKDRVLFKHQEQEEWLAVAIETLHPGFEHRIAPSRAPVPVPSAPAKAIPASFSRRKRIDRQLLIDADSDSTRLFLHGQPAVFLVNGRAQGVRLDVVNFFGFYGALGLRSGDVIKRVNGMELHDPTRLPSLVHHLKDERTFTLDILRNETPLTLTFDVG